MWHGRSAPYAHLPLNDALPGSRSFRVGRLPLVRQQQQQCCCYLIYNLPVLWRSGAAARWSRLHTPVETLTPPCRRGEIRSVPFPPAVCGLWAKTALRSFAPPLQGGAGSPLRNPLSPAGERGTGDGSGGLMRCFGLLGIAGGYWFSIAQVPVSVCYDFVTFGAGTPCGVPLRNIFSMLRF